MRESYMWRISNTLIVILILTPSSSLAFSEKTCVAYMEADAIKTERIEVISKVRDEILKAATKKFWETFKSGKISWTGKDGTNSIGKRSKTGSMPSHLGLRGHLGSVGWVHYHQKKWNGPEFAFESLADPYRKFVNPAMVTYQTASRAAWKVYEAKAKAIEKKRVEAYLAAYKGRRSKVNSVMVNLLNSDRRLCRFHFGG